MSTPVLLLCSLVPTLAGYLVNSLLIVPVIGTLLFRAAPVLAAAFCLWLGWRCAKNRAYLPSLLLTQWPSLICFALYVQQFSFTADTARNMFLALLAQIPGVPLLGPATRLVWLFWATDNTWDQTESLLANGISLALLAILFSLGFLAGRLRRARQE